MAFLGLAVVGVAIAELVAHRSLVGSSPPSSRADLATSTSGRPQLDEGHGGGPVEMAFPASAPSSWPARPEHSNRRLAAPDEDDGAIPNGKAVSVWDDELAAVGRLDPELLDALRRAAADAEADGVGIRVSSGWRSPEHQQQLLQDAIAEHGSQEEAARWVATPETSAHVSGDAVDVGPNDAAAWLSDHGAAYGLCPIYRNEPWHFEHRADAVDDGCPPLYADPTEDPRMQP